MTIPENDQLHFKWAFAAAKQGDVNGQAYTGECYRNGYGVEQNDESGFEWCMKAAEQDDVEAQYFIGQYYENGFGGVDLDLTQALFWYRKAAAQGRQSAMEAVERLA